MKKNEMIHICWAGPFYHIIDYDGKDWYFEMHHYCGPATLRKDGEPMKRQPGEKSPFWFVVTDWAQQGQEVDENNYCVYKSVSRPDDEDMYSYE